MATARRRKKAAGHAAQAADSKHRRAKARKPMRPMAARARTELRRGIFPTIQHAPESSHSGSAQLTERSEERFTNTFGLGCERAQHATEQTAANLGPAVQSGPIFASAVRSISQELLNFIQERMYQNFARLLALTYCRTPPQLLAVQRDLVRDNVEGFVRSTGRITDVSIRLAYEGVRRMSAASLAPR
jgi:phasin protein